MGDRYSFPRRVILPLLSAGLAQMFSGVEKPALGNGSAVQDDLLTALDNALWIPDGSNAQKQIYVMAAPWCPYCKTFYRLSRGLSNVVQFRWIEAGEINIPSAYQVREAGLSRDPELLAKFHGVYGRSAPSNVDDSAIAKNVSRYAFGINWRVHQSNKDASATSTGFPTIAFETSAGLTVATGTPENLAAIVPTVIPRPHAANIRPWALDLIRLQFPSRPMTHTLYYATPNNAPIFCLPDSRSPLIANPKKHQGYPAVGLTSTRDGGWLELQPVVGTGVYTGFGHQNDFEP